ncbi:MAG: hypothetical protein JWO13_46 [Acidobacteriales bacterium]|nr:hypothetical protein [Terriglobales bacterium]
MAYVHQHHHQDKPHPGALLWLIFGLLGAFGTLILIVSTVPRVGS